MTSKLKSRVHVKDKVKSLKNRIPGMKKRDAGGDDDSHDDNSEYDDGSPRVSASCLDRNPSSIPVFGFSPQWMSFDSECA